MISFLNETWFALTAHGPLAAFIVVTVTILYCLAWYVSTSKRFENLFLETYVKFICNKDYYERKRLEHGKI